MKLNFGVLDYPYSFGPTKPSKKSGKTGASTTGAVAEILEDKYHIMESFFNLHADDIVEALSDSVEGAFESLMMGGPAMLNPTAEGTNKIARMFQDFLTNREMDSLGIPGVPTKASLEGVSHRFKGKRNKRGMRPSFIDTGTYQSAFKCWGE